MSLINKMLQDLDARGTAPGEAFPPQIKPVAPAPRGLRPRTIAAGVAGACVVIALAWYAWGQFHAPDAPGAAGVAPAPNTVKPVPKAQPEMTSTITMEPANKAPSPAPVAAPSADAAPLPDAVPQPAAPAEAPPAAPVHKEASVSKRKVVAVEDTPRATVTAKSVAPVEPDSDEARAVRRALVQELEARQARHPAAKPRPAAAPVAGREQTAAQRAEGEYRRALSSMQEGRMSETIASLESALRIDPGHEAARQTLVGLLIEARRPDEAIRQLQLGLSQDPRQPALAMLLARLQIERGGTGIETLMRTLPYAGATPDYHAFLAGALQRQQRHREAASEYLAALRGAPANGVWWMGMGISLQAEKRNGEALEAFQKAQASGVLSVELQAFVERQIRQLGR